MKQEKINFAQISRTVLWLSLMICATFAAARAQPPNGTVIARVCFESKPETFTRTVAQNVSAGGTIILNQGVPGGFYRMIINPNGATEETFLWSRFSGSATHITTTDNSLTNQVTLYAHAAGETVLLMTDGEAVFGYNNTSSAVITIPKAKSYGNYFEPGPQVYLVQTMNFQPGVNENAFRVKVLSDLRSSSGNTVPTWFLNGSQATSTANAANGCGTITYQGRLSDAGASANGQFDLQFQAFETETGGAAQSGLITLENVQVTNGIFTVPLQFGSTLISNFKARFLEIGVRPGTSTDAFTVLTPRQPITSVPYAVNAQNATNATQLGGKSADSFLQNSTTAQTNTNFNISGNGTIGGNLTVNGTINGTATNAINANNAAQLGGVPAANYLTNTSTFGQSATTVSGTGGLTVTNAITAYTLVPGLTQTVNVPANSSLLISTDGGIISDGAAGSFTVVDVAVFVDGAAVSERRIVIGNVPLPSSVGNWTLSVGQSFAAGNHTIEIRARHGLNGSATSTVSSNSDPLLRGKLTVAVIKN